jgi:hypothetical protein
MKRYLIFAPPYREIRGGAIVLHKLCHLLNSVDAEAEIFPLFENQEINRLNFWKILPQVLRRNLRWSLKPFATNPYLNTPVTRSMETYNGKEDWIAVYPEVTLGNPLIASHVVRWFLHNPGFHKGSIYFGPGELHYKFNSAIQNFQYPGSVLSDQYLEVIHYPLELYNTEGIAKVRKGIAYCLRKGRHKKIDIDLRDAILIDGKSHREIAAIFKRVEQFISYDTYTAYSRFAALCGCDSIVVPEDGVSAEEWYPDQADRFGVSYGFDGIEEARATRDMLISRILSQEVKGKENVKNFIIETQNFFYESHKN